MAQCRVNKILSVENDGTKIKASVELSVGGGNYPGHVIVTPTNVVAFNDALQEQLDAGYGSLVRSAVYQHQGIPSHAILT